MRVLWVATKSPLPAVDGGCVVMARTLDALSDAGVGGTVVVPGTVARPTLGAWRIVGVPAASRAAQLARARDVGSLSIARHLQPAVAQAVATLVARGDVDVVHAEQMHALPQCAPAAARGVPVVLRVQNVEHEVLAARATGRLTRALVAGEIRRLRTFEARALRTVTTTIALTASDAERLAALAGRTADVRHLPAPFPAELPAGPALDGAPALVVFGSPGWFPNRRGADWFVADAWPRVRARLPAARLHVVAVPAAAGAGVVRHPPPRDSATAFAAGAILVVPSRVATGVRMKILEAWARGLPVVTTPEAATGLDGCDGETFLLAADAAGFADAVARLHGDPALAARLRAGGRAMLRRHHAPSAIAAGLLAAYTRVSAPATADPRPPAQAAW